MCASIYFKLLISCMHGSFELIMISRLKCKLAEVCTEFSSQKCMRCCTFWWRLAGFKFNMQIWFNQ